MAQSMLERLQRIPLFQAAGDTGLELIASQLSWHNWSRRQLVMPPEETLRRYYVLIVGRAKISVQNPGNGRELTLQLLRVGDGHDLISLLGGEAHDVQATTLDSAEAVSAPISTWRQWLSDYPSLRRFMLYYVGARLQALSLLAGDLALHDTSTRLAHLLLGNLDDSNTETDHPLGGLAHEEIAQLIGTVREVVNRLLNRLKREGVIHATGGTLRVADLERLLERAETQYAVQFGERHSDDSYPHSGS